MVGLLAEIIQPPAKIVELSAQMIGPLAEMVGLSAEIVGPLAEMIRLLAQRVERRSLLFTISYRISLTQHTTNNSPSIQYLAANIYVSFILTQ
jgi:hypothetical protein